MNQTFYHSRFELPSSLFVSNTNFPFYSLKKDDSTIIIVKISRWYLKKFSKKKKKRTKKSYPIRTPVQRLRKRWTKYWTFVRETGPRLLQILPVSESGWPFMAARERVSPGREVVTRKVGTEEKPLVLVDSSREAMVSPFAKPICRNISRRWCFFNDAYYWYFLFAIGP